MTKKVASVIVGTWLVGLVAATITRIPVWRSDQTLWASVVAAGAGTERVPIRAWVNLGDLEQATRASVRPRLRQPFGRAGRPAATVVNENRLPREDR